jgi:hypothetical protein
MRYINPETEGVHPLRLELTDEDMGDILKGIEDGANWMSLDELDAALDYLHDFIVAKKQTVEGVTTLQ